MSETHPDMNNERKGNENFDYEEDYSNDKKYYIDYWKRVLYVLLGWSEERVLRWAQIHEDGLNGANDGMFYHEPPSNYVSKIFSTEKLRKQMTITVNFQGQTLEPTLDVMQLCEKVIWPIESVLIKGEPSKNEVVADSVLFELKKEVEAILNKYGESLENISKLPPEDFTRKGIIPADS
ncbi:MAG: hypothetical protein JXM70_28460 [Pirellulales bacterium]|nr:hypothetical protein [Pirellulales bacterium]